MQSFPIQSISDLEKISASAKWQYFEKLVAFIFEQNGYDAKQNIIIKHGEMKRQFDVIARGFGKTFLVECKKWRARKEMSSALKSAVRKHLERCSFYSELHEKENIFLLIVTLMYGEIAIQEGVPIVPIMKLNAFLQELDIV